MQNKGAAFHLGMFLKSNSFPDGEKNQKQWFKLPEAMILYTSSSKIFR